MGLILSKVKFLYCLEPRPEMRFLFITSLFYEANQVQIFFPLLFPITVYILCVRMYFMLPLSFPYQVSYIKPQDILFFRLFSDALPQTEHPQ